jgi:DNA ligase-1
MLQLAQAAERIAATTKKLEKTAIVAEYLRSRDAQNAAVSAVFLSGRPFPLWEETTLQVGGSLLWRLVEELSGKNDAELSAAYRLHGDLGAVAGVVLPSRKLDHVLTPAQVAEYFRKVALVRGPAAKAALIRELFSHVTPLEAKYIIKIMTGDLRIGLKESLVEEAIAKANAAPVSEVQRANMLLGDIGEVVKYAVAGKLAEAKMRLFHPLGFMLASPAESAEEALSYFQNGFVEDKFDGIRAQAHVRDGEVRIFSRTRDEITESFPELPEALSGLPDDVILDGEIVAWSYDGEATGRALPFTALQQRLGRKKVSEDIVRAAPVAYLAFDILYAGGELLIDRPLRQRAKILDELLGAKPRPGKARTPGAQGKLTFEAVDPGIKARIIRSPMFSASSPQELDSLFEAAQARGNEGLMIKDSESAYAPGRRGKSWLKLKRELATLDVVVTAVEYGHGKRIGVLSDYTFAVRDEDRLVNIGKAYSGLTDAEIAEMTKWFLEHTVEEQGLRLIVEPKIVVEIAFNNMMRSDRHDSGFALRFPRIVRLRPDKSPEEADTLDRVKEIYAKQSERERPG